MFESEQLAAHASDLDASTSDPSGTGTPDFGLSLPSLFVRKFCMSECRHSLLALLFHLHGFWGPDPWLFSFIGFLGPMSLAVFFLRFFWSHSTFSLPLCSFVSVVANRTEHCSSLDSCSFFSRSHYCFLSWSLPPSLSLSLLWLLSCRSAHRVPNESVHFSSCSRYDCDLPPSRPSSQLLLSALFNLPLPVAFSSDHHISLQSRQ